MNFQVKLIKNEQRRAVAPIIATLLMVAISVVGGILIFVFSQGFFKDTSIQSPTIDALEIWGYNAQDVLAADFFLHTDVEATCGSGTVNQKISDGECFGIFIRNVGSNVVVLETVRVAGVDIDITAAAGAVSATVPVKGDYCIVQNTACSIDPFLQPGQEATILVHNDRATISGDIKIGRPIIFALETGQGFVFTKQIRSGLLEGIRAIPPPPPPPPP